MKKPLPPRASLQDGIAKLKAMPAGSIIQGSPGAFENASDAELYLLERAQRASREAFDAALALVPDVEPLEEDRLP